MPYSLASGPHARAVYGSAMTSPVQNPPAVARPFAFGGSFVGTLHERIGLPCQDACCELRIDPDQLVISVADGLGSAERADEGAVLAANSACKAVTEALAESAEIGAAAEAGVRAAREALERQAEGKDCELRNFATTLIVAVAQGDSLQVAQIGDGAVVAALEDELDLVSGPGDSEYVNEVTPLTSDYWESALQISELRSGVRCFAVFTDGCQRAALKRERSGFVAFPGFFTPVFEFALGLAEPDSGSIAIEQLLKSAKFRDNCEDDSTLVIGVLENG
jgi:hypothetical protein